MVKELIFGDFVKLAVSDGPIEFQPKRLIPPQQATMPQRATMPQQQPQMLQQQPASLPRTRPGAGPVPQMARASRVPPAAGVPGSVPGSVPNQPPQPGPVQGGQAPPVGGQQVDQQLPVTQPPTGAAGAPQPTGGSPVAGQQPNAGPQEQPPAQTQPGPQQTEQPQPTPTQPQSQGTPPPAMPQVMEPEAFAALDRNITQAIEPQLQQMMLSGDVEGMKAFAKEHAPEIEQWYGQKAMEYAKARNPENPQMEFGRLMVKAQRDGWDANDIRDGVTNLALSQARTELSNTGPSREAIAQGINEQYPRQPSEQEVQERANEKLNDPEQAQGLLDFWKNADSSQKIGMVLGGGLALMSLANILFNGGGLMSMIGLLVGGAGMLSSGGAFGDQFNIAKLLGGGIQGLMGGGQGEQPGQGAQGGEATPGGAPQANPPQPNGAGGAGDRSGVYSMLQRHIPQAREEFAKQLANAPAYQRGIYAAGGGRDLARQLIRKQVRQQVESQMAGANIPPQLVEQFTDSLMADMGTQGLEQFVDEVMKGQDQQLARSDMAGRIGSTMSPLYKLLGGDQTLRTLGAPI